MLSIIIPAYNEERYLFNTLSNLIEIIKVRGCLHEVEVIVVDNGSSDRTPEECNRFSEVNLIRLPDRVTVSEARNRGVYASSGDCIAFIDADILITEQWLAAALEFSRNILSDKRIVTGHKVYVSRNPSKIELYWFACLKSSAATYINSGNLICSRYMFDLVGGFNESLKTGEDVDFCERAINAGASLRPNKDYFVFHEGYPKTLDAFFKRERWHGIGDVQSFTKLIRSKVALSGYICAFLTISILSFISVGMFLWAGLFFIFLSLMNLTIVVKRLTIFSPAQLAYAFFLNYVYLMARFASSFYRSQHRLR